MARKRILSTKMSKRLSFYGLVGLTSLCIFFLLFNQRYSSYIENRLQPVLSEVELKPKVSKYEGFSMALSAKQHYAYRQIPEVIEHQARLIAKELENYEYPNGKYGINASSLDDLLMEKNGRPLRSVLVSSWRSGSTFVGDLINAHPATYYHYEPLLDFGIIQVRGPPLAQEALKNIIALFNCDYGSIHKLLLFGREHPWVFNHNTPLWRQCTIHKRICWNTEFVSRFCKQFPFQSMKLVRLRLKVAEALLEDESLGVRMVFLIRDPRGLLQSRKHRNWCPGHPDCSNIASVCDDMVSDYESAVRLKKKYPRNFKIVRYEDLSLDPFAQAKELYQFYGLYFHDDVVNFLETHTKSDLGGVSSTFRNSKAAPFHWRNDLAFEETEEIQTICSEAMKLWGYVPAFNETHQRDFKPIIDFNLVL